MFSKSLFVAVAAVSLGASVAGCSAEEMADAEAAASEDGAVGTSEDAIGAEFICDRARFGNLLATPARQGQLVAVRAGRPGDFDRFVMEFERGTEVPRFRIEKGDASFPTIEGTPLRLQGAKGLLVTTTVASGWDMEKGKPSYTGPLRFETGNTQIVKEVARVEDFEGTLAWGIGLAGAVCFRVTKLTNPPRLVVDMQRKPG